MSKRFNDDGTPFRPKIRVRSTSEFHDWGRCASKRDGRSPYLWEVLMPTGEWQSCGAVWMTQERSTRRSHITFSGVLRCYRLKVESHYKRRARETWCPLCNKIGVAGRFAHGKFSCRHCKSRYNQRPIKSLFTPAKFRAF